MDSIYSQSLTFHLQRKLFIHLWKCFLFNDFFNGFRSSRLVAKQFRYLWFDLALCGFYLCVLDRWVFEPRFMSLPTPSNAIQHKSFV
jgi:hypothetical protein